MSRRPPRAKKALKPKTPEQIAAEKRQRRANDLAAVSMSPDAAALAQHADIEVTRAGAKRADGKRVDDDVARRLDAFEALRPSMTGDLFVGAYDAARRLERDFLISRGQHDHGRTPDRVDCEQAAFSRVDAIIMAAERVKKIIAKIPDREALLLTQLMDSEIVGEKWRDTVARITAETNHNAQGAIVRSACVNLRDAYQRQDVAGRKAA